MKVIHKWVANHWENHDTIDHKNLFGVAWMFRNLFFFFFLRFLHYYLEDGFNQRRRDREKYPPPPTNLPVHYPNSHNDWNWAYLKPGPWRLLGPYPWLQGPKVLGHPLLHPHATIRELEEKWSSLDTLHTHSIPAHLEEVQPTKPSHQIPFLFVFYNKSSIDTWCR